MFQAHLNKKAPLKNCLAPITSLGNTHTLGTVNSVGPAVEKDACRSIGPKQINDVVPARIMYYDYNRIYQFL
jgi:hypothetical protein